MSDTLTALIPQHSTQGRDVMLTQSKFEALTTPKPGAKMTTRCPRKAAKVFKALIASTYPRPVVEKVAH